MKNDLPKSEFVSHLVRVNQLDVYDFDRFIFFHGMLFGSEEKWWGKKGARRSSHEGLDVCFFANTRNENFRLDENSIVAVAGYHISENLAWGKFLYVEDLITNQKNRSQGFGKQLLGWLHDEAAKQNCSQLHLDSGVQRKDAHRFYQREGMTFASHHYVSQL